MATYNNNFIRLFRSLDVPDNVIAGRVRQSFRCKGEMNANAAHTCEVCDSLCILVGRRRSRDLWYCRVITHRTCVNKSILRTSCRTDDHGNRSITGSSHCTPETVRYCLPIGCTTKSALLHLAVKFVVEQHDLSGDPCTPKSLEFVEVINNDHICREALCRCCNAAAE